VRGTIREGDSNGFKDACDVAENIVIPKPQDSVIVISKPFVAKRIQGVIRVLALHPPR
jgi:hypothetical protein